MRKTRKEVPPVQSLPGFLDACPTPFHATKHLLSLLQEQGVTVLDATAPWPQNPGSYVLRTDGFLAAWHIPDTAHARTPLRVVGVHTDSPNFRIKPNPDVESHGWDMARVDPYGGLIASTWVDRDLGVAGRALVRSQTDKEVSSEKLFQSSMPILRISHLAIHLDRSTNDGDSFNRQRELQPHWGPSRKQNFFAWMAETIGCPSEDILAWEAMTFPAEPARRIGPDLLVSARLDNLASCWAGMNAFLEARENANLRVIPLLVCFDHEEIGSVTARGAATGFFTRLVEEIYTHLNADITARRIAWQESIVASADMAHAVHPNYADRHDPEHQVHCGQGVVLKVNVNGRYATEARGEAAWKLAAEKAQVPVQNYVHRSDLPCGSTIGPTLSANLGIPTVDVGAPMLSMHSARELCQEQDITDYAQVLGQFFQS